LEETGLDARSLKLEITESIAVDDVESTIATLRELKQLGVALAVDDFGTGYSSLSYLKRFPIDVLKIARPFVEGLGRDPEDTALVRATIAFARAFGLDVTGEGVETAEQLAQLLEMGCDTGQGYYFAKPMPGEALCGLFSVAQGR
jgi:EAL domain-containing protein (putative c-di-GMP-specific phosphodiesterase class I)